MPCEEPCLSEPVSLPSVRGPRRADRHGGRTHADHPGHRSNRAAAHQCQPDACGHRADRRSPRPLAAPRAVACAGSDMRSAAAGHAAVFVSYPARPQPGAHGRLSAAAAGNGNSAWRAAVSGPVNEHGPGSQGADGGLSPAPEPSRSGAFPGPAEPPFPTPPPPPATALAALRRRRRLRPVRCRLRFVARS